MKKIIEGIKIFSENHSITTTIIFSVATLISFLGAIFGSYCLVGWIFMLLWNWLAVSLLGLKVLGFWVSVGIVVALKVVGKLLFKNNITIKNGEE